MCDISNGGAPATARDNRTRVPEPGCDELFTGPTIGNVGLSRELDLLTSMTPADENSPRVAVSGAIRQKYRPGGRSLTR